VGLSEEDREAIRDVELLTEKEIVLVLNVGEEQLQTPSPAAAALEAYASEHGYPCISLCAKVEAEIAQLPPEEEAEFLAAMGIAEPGRNRFIRVCYDRLGLISFFTVGEDEVKAWTIRKGSTAVQAAGKIHTDLARGFIRADVMQADDLLRMGSEREMKAHHLVRSEHKDYPVQDGDILYIHFNV